MQFWKTTKTIVYLKKIVHFKFNLIVEPSHLKLTDTSIFKGKIV